MIDVNESLELLDRSLPKEEIEKLSNSIGKIIGYNEAGMKVNGVLTTHLYGLKYFK